MYLLFLDESGTHESSPCLVLAGFAVHEHDAHHLQKALNGVLGKYLVPLALDPKQFELHANEIKNPEGKKHKYSPWKQVDWKLRGRILGDAYKTLSGFKPADPALPMAAFAVVVDKKKHGESLKREEIAYELILNKFDVMLGRVGTASGQRQCGIVIHDERVVAETDVQSWTDAWRQAAGRVGKLVNLAEVPLFADSRASRLLQAADLVAYSVWRYYGIEKTDDKYIDGLWRTFDRVGAEMHGIIHVAPEFAQGTCKCPPCHTRINSPSYRKWAKRRSGNAGLGADDVARLKNFFTSRD